jgi:hypothetical protein
MAARIVNRTNETAGMTPREKHRAKGHREKKDRAKGHRAKGHREKKTARGRQAAMTGCERCGTESAYPVGKRFGRTGARLYATRLVITS